MSSLEPVAHHTYGPADDVGEADSERLAGLVWRVQHVGRMAAVSVVIDPELNDNASTVEGHRCGHAPLIAIGHDLIGEARTDTLAHELAHRDLAHHKRALPLWIAAARDLDGVGGLYAVITALLTPGWSGWSWAAAALFAAMLALAALRARLMRLEEYDADARAVEILDAADLPGKQIVTAMLTDADRPYDAWHTWIGWMFSTHPSDVERIHVVDSGRRAGRLDWRTALCCVATGERLLTRAHRAAHRAADGRMRRCQPGWWHLPPVWWRPIDWPTTRNS
ncbi:peptidase M48-like protein [Nonomuraea polychroma]|uniref:Peptidase M48-like protein n=1 Tax=Nonomuraea polychroma TaxID=46176 RepID=A0A438M002_9ACTN|nr:M48 family metalloprotease [Nonomuraea polychroma]RVX39120.1 peptidase M48-like protein [Nonomuraea polychroma]